MSQRGCGGLWKKAKLPYALELVVVPKFLIVEFVASTALG
jgi:hypothetical protein